MAVVDSEIQQPDNTIFEELAGIWPADPELDAPPSPLRERPAPHAPLISCGHAGLKGPMPSPVAPIVATARSTASFTSWERAQTAASAVEEPDAMDFFAGQEAPLLQQPLFLQNRTEA